MWDHLRSYEFTRYHLRSYEFKCCPVTTHDQRWVGGLLLLLHEQEKRNIYGKRFRIAVGGKNPGGAADPRPDDLVEPVFSGASQAPSTKRSSIGFTPKA